MIFELDHLEKESADTNKIGMNTGKYLPFKVKQLKIEASSSDGEGFDIKTPTYFCFDDFGATGEEILPEKNTEVSTAITAHNANATATARGSYDISGRQTNGLNKGVNIIRMSDGSVRKVVIK